jgi:3',5'-nucleoside bisphosphate phosphatase
MTVPRSSVGEARAEAARGAEPGGEPAFADLHLHTLFSDGTYTPEELVQHAARQHLAAIALTDHDTVEGCARTAAACAQVGIEFFPAVELTCELDQAELHLLAYGVDIDHPGLLAAMDQFQQVRQNRIREMVTRLNQLEVPLQAHTVFALANCRSPGRPHVGRALVAGGFCSSVDEAFDRFLKRNRPAWVPKFKISARDALTLIHQSGGLAVMAHPALNRIDHLIPDLVAMGLDGLECFHTKHNTGTTAHYQTLARHHGLLVTGGSDCHGMAKGKPLIGTVRLPYEFVERLKSKLTERHAVPVPPAPSAAP